MGMCYFYEGWFSLRVNRSLSAGGQTRWQKRRWFISFWTPPLVDGSIHKRERQLGCQPRHLLHWQLSIIPNIGQCDLTAKSGEEQGKDFWENVAGWVWSPGCVVLWKMMFPSRHSDTHPTSIWESSVQDVFCETLWWIRDNCYKKSYPLEFYSLILRKKACLFRKWYAFIGLIPINLMFQSSRPYFVHKTVTAPPPPPSLP